MTTQRVDVIGAGISGLATAWFLARRRSDVAIHVWEAAPEPGGLAGCFHVDGLTLENFYHHIYRRDVALQNLIAELGLAGQLIWRPASTGAYYFKRAYRFSSPIDLLRFDQLPLIDRLRAGWMILHARLVRDWRTLDDEPASSYIRRIGGENVYRVMWEPLLRGKFGRDADSVSAAWLWRKLVDRGGSRDSTGHEQLGYVRGGLVRVFDAMVAELRERGHSVHFGTRVTALEGSGAVTHIATSAGTFATDAVVAAGQLPDIVRLLPESLASYRERLSRIEFLANVCLVMLMRKPLSEFYWTNVTDPSAPFVGIVEQSHWAAPEDLAGHRVAYVSAYVPQDDPRLSMTADDLFESYLPHMQKLFPHFTRDAVTRLLVRTARYTQPIVRTGYRHLVPDIETPARNLFVCTMAQIYPHDRQVSNGVEMAERTASLVAHAVVHSRPSHVS
ncbi:MAG TPA: NAD(P)/FAD-dependent oxidoreductase [Thermoanaerobaculia bacterium]|nr:NAD(P)/FAD-dependent oxidoreductase [Thermoanaerobaculia bacterium]